MTPDQRLGLADLINEYQYIPPEDMDRLLEAITDNQRKRFWALHFSKDKVEFLKMIDSIQWYVTTNQK